jgi:uncharacterized protein YjbI with pentapeptide repeats
MKPEYICKNGAVEADLRGANLRGANLRGANLRGANLREADLRGADLCEANLRWANLREANLYGADLYGADLRGANLRGANLREADLREADLYGANLRGATGIDRRLSTPLMMLLDQPGKIRLYKMVSAEYQSPIHSTKITYAAGESYSVTDANTDEHEQCAAGINVATSDWIVCNWTEGNRILLVEFGAADIACIPTATDGKIRLHRCKVVGEIPPQEWGLDGEVQDDP